MTSEPAAETPSERVYPQNSRHAPAIESVEANVVGQALYELRQSAGIEMRHLAKHLRTGRQSLFRLEDGSIRPTVARVGRYVKGVRELQRQRNRAVQQGTDLFISLLRSEYPAETAHVERIVREILADPLEPLDTQ